MTFFSVAFDFLPDLDYIWYAEFKTAVSFLLARQVFLLQHTFGMSASAISRRACLF